MSAVHPSPEIPPALVDKIVARRGRLHVYEQLDPAHTALIVIDLDSGSCAREPELTEAAIGRINAIARPLRGAGGTVAFVTSMIEDPNGLARRLGDASASRYFADSQPGGLGTMLAPSLGVSDGDLHAVKRGASAFFPGRCDLHERLVARKVNALLIAGLVTNVCCESSARMRASSAIGSPCSLMAMSGIRSAFTRRHCRHSSGSSVTCARPTT